MTDDEAAGVYGANESGCTGCIGIARLKEYLRRGRNLGVGDSGGRCRIGKRERARCFELTGNLVYDGLDLKKVVRVIDALHFSI